MSGARTAAIAATCLAVLALGGSLLLGLRGDPVPLAEAPPAADPPTRRVRVEVLNAGGVAGAARGATRTLRDAGFDVVYFGNARGLSGDSSRVVDRAGREADAARIAEVLQIERVESRPDSSLYLEATVVIGRDWRGAPGR